MAWVLIDVDDNGRARWANQQNFQEQQYLPVGQDPNGASGPNLYGWDPNMAVPEGGFTLGQLLAPNYFSQGTTLDDPAALAAAVRDVAPGYTGPLDMNARVPNNQVRAPAKDNGFENLLGAGAMAGLGFLSGGFGIPELWGNLFGSPATITSASGANPTLVGGWEWTSDPRFAGTTVDGVVQQYGNGMDWLNTDWGTEGLVDSSWTTDPRFNGTTVDFTTTRVGSGVNMNDYYSMLDDIQAGTNGVTAPSPTMSVPGYGDVYGSPSTILKSLVGSGMSPTNAMSMLQKALGGDSSALSALGGALGGINGLSSGSIFDTLGKLAPSLLGMYASNQQANKLSELAQKYQDFGAPYRQQLADISANPDNFYNSLGAQKATDAVLNKLSIGGNPAGSANKQALTIDSLYDQYGKERDRLAGFGGLTNYNQAAPNLEAQAIGANANMWNAAGAGLNDIFNPKTSLADLLKQGKIA